MKLPDYYATLDVDKRASADEIKKAFRRLARKFHPDISKEPDAAARMTEINEANEVLSDPEKRKIYDQIGHEAWAKGARSVDDVRPPPGWSQGFKHSGGTADFGQDRSEFFEELFGRAAQQRSQHHSYQTGRGPDRWDGQDQRVDITLSLEQAYQGTQKSIQLSAYRIDANGQVIPESRTLDVTIPAGVAQGQLIRLSGQGGPGFGGGKSGDLYLHVQIEPTPGITIDGRDVTIPVFITAWEAALSADITVKTPAGALTISVPAGSVAGRKLRLKGKGIPAARGGASAGDLYCELKIAVPSAVTEEQKQAWQALAQAYAGFELRERSDRSDRK
jgi:curved DNA-binding protein